MTTPAKDFDTLIKELHDNNEWVATPAAEALSESDDPRLIPHFLHELDYNTRQAKFDQVLEQRRKSGGRTWMLGYNSMCLTELRIAVAKGLRKLIGDEVIPIFTKILDEDPDFDLCSSIASWLSEFPSDKTVETLDRCMIRAHTQNADRDLVHMMRSLNRIDTPGAKEAVERWQKVVGKVL